MISRQQPVKNVHLLTYILLNVEYDFANLCKTVGGSWAFWFNPANPEKTLYMQEKQKEMNLLDAQIASYALKYVLAWLF